MDGMLSQEEINALLSGNSLEEEIADSEDNEMTPMEIDTLSEISNICMGTAATTLSALVNQKVDITTPNFSVSDWDELAQAHDRPCVFLQIAYKENLDGRNILILKEKDVKIIADLMMGGDGSNVEGELGNLQLSAISEAMNQMMGSAATSLSSMLGEKIDISPPVASLVDLNSSIDEADIASFLDKKFIRIAFKMTIGDLVDSEMMQLYPIEFSKKLYKKFSPDEESEEESKAKDVDEASLKKEENNDFSASNQNPNSMDQNSMNQNMMNQGMNPNMMNQGMMNQGMNPNMMNQGMMNPNMMNQGMNPNMMNQGMMNPNMMNQGMMNPNMMNQGMPYPNMAYGQVPEINVQQAQFQTFSPDLVAVNQKENINLIMDVPLEVTVELGRTSKSIQEILEFAPGTIIELDKIAGEPIDVLVNGKYVAKGEVVVIEESFGIRVTEIIK